MTLSPPWQQVDLTERQDDLPFVHRPPLLGHTLQWHVREKDYHWMLQVD